MSGECDLDRLLRYMQPVLDRESYVFLTMADRKDLDLARAAWGAIREDEGLTLIMTCRQAQDSGLPADDRWARITLAVHSDLHAVGFLAAVSHALASRGISLNAVSAYHHDHLFVPWHSREEAMVCLVALANAASPPDEAGV